MKLSKLLAKEVTRSNGNMVIQEVPESHQPKPEVLSRLGEEISAQIRSNEAASNRSLINALFES